MQRAIDGLGAVHNIQLSRLWGTKKLLLVEGDDMQILLRFHDLICPESLDSFAAIPNISIGGWGGWNYAVGSSMLLQNAGGDDISSYCILDSDYHTPTEIESRMKDAAAKNVRLHIWQRKEIENYLVVPAAIQRAIARAANKPPSVDDVTDKILQIANLNRHDVYDNFAESFHNEDRGKGQKTANARARALLDPSWTNGGEAHYRVSGKAILSSLSEWSKKEFDVSFGVAAILRELRREDLSPEVVAVISSIDENELFLLES
jgi:hypothetical protein